MKHIVVMTVIGASLAGCANTGLGVFTRRGEKAEVAAPVVDGPTTTVGPKVRPPARPNKAEKPVSAVRTVAPKVNLNGPIGITVASLGNPAEAGLWLKTPLVIAEQSGRVIYKGKTAVVTLIPIEGVATAGSRMSLQAFQALGAPLTDLVEVKVSL
jgi:hypothetical protein